MSPEQRRIIVLMRADKPSGVPDTTPINADCGCPCWIAPSSLLLHLDASVTTETKCMEHAGFANIADIKAAGEQGQVRVIPGQQDELDEIMGREAAERMLRQLHVKEGLD